MDVEKALSEAADVALATYEAARRLGFAGAEPDKLADMIELQGRRLLELATEIRSG